MASLPHVFAANGIRLVIRQQLDGPKGVVVVVETLANDAWFDRRNLEMMSCREKINPARGRHGEVARRATRPPCQFSLRDGPEERKADLWSM